MNKTIKRLTGYYGLLQTVHISFLTWAGISILRSGEMTSLSLPPLVGWSPQVIPFLIGLGLADAIAAGLGIIYAIQTLVKDNWQPYLGLVSISLALASALIFLVGTLASGAWSHHPIEYLSMVGLFSPIPLLYIILFRYEANRSLEAKKR